MAYVCNTRMPALYLRCCLVDKFLLFRLVAIALTILICLDSHDVVTKYAVADGCSCW